MLPSRLCSTNRCHAEPLVDWNHGRIYLNMADLVKAETWFRGAWRRAKQTRITRPSSSWRAPTTTGGLKHINKLWAFFFHISPIPKQGRMWEEKRRRRQVWFADTTENKYSYVMKNHTNLNNYKFRHLFELQNCKHKRTLPPALCQHPTTHKNEKCFSVSGHQEKKHLPKWRH
jgi:hypothetical protein